jgi:hypothetical protein
MTRQVLLTLGLVSALAASPLAQSRDWKRALEDALEQSVYTKSTVARLNGNRVTREGTALVVTRTGILASPAGYLGAANTRIRDGKVIQPGGTASFFADRSTRQFKMGDVVYLTDVQVRDDLVVLEIVSRDIVATIDRGSTMQTRFKGQVEFEFDPVVLQASTPEALKRAFEEVLTEAVIAPKSLNHEAHEAHEGKPDRNEI